MARGVPTEVTYQTHDALAWELIRLLHERRVLPFGWVAFDEAFGRDTVLLDRVDGLGLSYLAEVPHDTRVWRVRPETAVPAAKRRGRRPRRVRGCPDEAPPVRVDTLAASLPRAAWRRRVIKEGAKGPIVAEVARVRAVAVRAGLPGPAVWVVFRRSLGATPGLKTYLSNASVVTPLGTLVRLSGMRWPVESAIEEGKGEVGLDQYEVRGWRGWHHHLTLSFLAHHFLVRQRRRLGGKSPALTVPQVRVLLQVTLPRRSLDAETVLEIIAYTQAQNFKAYQSHRRGTLRNLDSS